MLSGKFVVAEDLKKHATAHHRKFEIQGVGSCIGDGCRRINDGHETAGINCVVNKLEVILPIRNNNWQFQMSSAIDNMLYGRRRGFEVSRVVHVRPPEKCFLQHDGNED